MPEREVRFAVRVTPRGGTDRVDGPGDDGVLRVRVAAPAAEGAANAALLRVIASELGVPRSAVRLVTGVTARRKLIAIEGITQEAVRARWPGLSV